MEKGLYIQDLKEDRQMFSGVFAITEASKAQAKNGPYWKFTIGDATGTLEARIWSRNGMLYPADLPSEVFGFITGRTSLYNGVMQASVDGVDILTEEQQAEINPDDFLRSPFDADALFDQLHALAEKEFTFGPWRTLVLGFLNDPDQAAQFRAASAAKSIHHAGRGGLVAHTLEVTRTCQAIADIYPGLDRQTLLAGAIFHDIGKMAEMKTNLFGTSYTTEGTLLGHLYMGASMLEPLCQKAGLPEPLTRHLLHLVLSHHGLPEYETVRKPMSREALALHMADNMSAKLTSMETFLAENPTEEDTVCQRMLFGTSVYRPAPTPEAQETGAEQPPLFPPVKKPAPRAPKPAAAPKENPRAGQENAGQAASHKKAKYQSGSLF